MEYPFIIAGYGRSRNPVNWFYDPSYSVNRLYYINSGTACYKKSRYLREGKLYLFRADPGFEVSQDPEDPVDHTFFDFITFGDYIRDEITEVDPQQVPGLSSLLRLVSDDFADGSCPEMVAASYLQILCHLLIPRMEEKPLYSRVTMDVLTCIQESDPADLSLSRIAASRNWNVDHMIRCFKKDMGITPHKYICRIKTDLAMRYASQGKSLQDIADLLGYASVSSLSAAFKKVTRHNLSDYKRTVNTV